VHAGDDTDGQLIGDPNLGWPCLVPAEAHRAVCDVDFSCGEVDVDLADLQMSADDGLKRAARDRGEDRSQQQVSGLVCEVVVAAAFIGPQGRSARRSRRA
jgi:hypothetical protein